MAPVVDPVDPTLHHGPVGAVHALADDGTVVLLGGEQDIAPLAAHPQVVPDCQYRRQVEFVEGEALLNSTAEGRYADAHVLERRTAVLGHISTERGISQRLQRVEDFVVVWRELHRIHERGTCTGSC